MEQKIKIQIICVTEKKGTTNKEIIKSLVSIKDLDKWCNESYVKIKNELLNFGDKLKKLEIYFPILNTSKVFLQMNNVSYYKINEIRYDVDNKVKVLDYFNTEIIRILLRINSGSFLADIKSLIRENGVFEKVDKSYSLKLDYDYHFNEDNDGIFINKLSVDEDGLLTMELFNDKTLKYEELDEEHFRLEFEGDKTYIVGNVFDNYHESYFNVDNIFRLIAYMFS